MPPWRARSGLMRRDSACCQQHRQCLDHRLSPRRDGVRRIYLQARPQRAVAVEAAALGRRIDLGQGGLQPDRRPLRPRHRGRRLISGRRRRRATRADPRRRLHHQRERRNGRHRRASGCSISAAAPIFVPPDAGECRRRRDGTVSADGQPLGQIGLVDARRPDRAEPPRRRRSFRGRRRHRAGRGAADAAGLSRGIERQPDGRDRPDDRGAARLRAGPEAFSTRKTSESARSSHRPADDRRYTCAPFPSPRPA